MRLAGMSPNGDKPSHEIFEAEGGDRFEVRILGESDEAQVGAFLRHIGSDDIRRRFFVSVRIFDHRFLWPLVHYDHRNGVAFMAIDAATREVAGIVRLHCDALGHSGEFAVLVRSDFKHRGLGHHLMRRILAWAEQRALPLVRGEVLHENAPMLDLCRSLGFHLTSCPDDPGLVIAESTLSTT